MTALRPPWEDLPAFVTDAVAVLLGSPVVAAVSQTSGFSPGHADRVVTASGRRAFVKAAPESLGAAADLYRAEAAALALLPPEVGAPELLGVVGEDGWVAIVTEEIDGTHPSEPPTREELVAILDEVAQAPAWADPDEVPHTEASLSVAFAVWPSLAVEHPDAVPEWTLPLAEEFDALAVAAAEETAGERVVHLDLRADNVLIDRTGRARLVDWAWASAGAPWIDALTMLIDARRLGSPDTDALLAEHPAFDGVTASTVDGALAGLAGLFLSGSLNPAPPRMPELRPFQAVEAHAAFAWLRDRRDARSVSRPA
ncbi:phosphotransferase [Leifsonia sp. NPDC080035]|uniref:Phosphotransferase n=1 Tax=Leifsonia sp. NPDC080035 TaxID=3143936 RepID=A0AAU7GGU0_9MICO